MISMTELALRCMRLAAFGLAAFVVWRTGLWLGGRRGPRPQQVIRYDDSLAGVGIFFIPAGIAAAVAKILHVPGWDIDLVWWMSGGCFFACVCVLLIVFRYRITLTDHAILESRVFRPGLRRVEATSIECARPGRRAGSLILDIRGGGKFEFAPIYKQGSEAFYDWMAEHNVPLEETA